MSISITNASSGGICRSYSDDYHPCTFPFTSRASAFNLKGSSTACDVTYAESSGSLHTVSCVLHSVSATCIMACFLRQFYISVKRRKEREKRGCKTPKRASLSELATSVSRRGSALIASGISDVPSPTSNPVSSFCFGLSTIEESYLLAAMGYALVAVGSIDLYAYAGRIPYRSDSLIIEAIYSLFTSIAMFVVTSWAKSFYRRNNKYMLLLDRALYCSLAVMWIISMILAAVETSESRNGTYLLLPNRVKHLSLIPIDLLYAVFAAGLGLKLRGTLAKASLNRKSPDSRVQGQHQQAQRTIGAFSVLISCGLTIVTVFRVSRILLYWGETRVWSTPPCDAASSVLFMPYTGPVVWGAVFLVCLESCDCCTGTLNGSGGGSMLGLMTPSEGSFRRSSLSKLAWGSGRQDSSSSDSNGGGSNNNGSTTSLQSVPEKISEASNEGARSSSEVGVELSPSVSSSPSSSSTAAVAATAALGEEESSGPTSTALVPSPASKHKKMGAPASSPRLWVKTASGVVGESDGDGTESPMHSAALNDVV